MAKLQKEYNTSIDSPELKVELELYAVLAGLKQFVKQNLPEHPVVETINKLKLKPEYSPYKVEIIFLTDMHTNLSKYEDFYDWLGIDNNLLELLNSKTGIVERAIDSEYGPIKFDLCHYQNLPIRPLGYERPHLQFLIIDDSFVNLPDFKVILDMVTVERPFVLLASLSEEINAEEIKYNLYKRAIRVETLPLRNNNFNSFIHYLEEAEILKSKKSIHLYNAHVLLNNFYFVVNNLVDSKLNSLESRIIFSKKDLIHLKEESRSVSSSDYSKLKAKIQKEVKILIRNLEDKTEELAKNKSELSLQLSKEIENLPNIQIEEGIKYNTLKVQSSFIANLGDKIINNYSRLFGAELIRINNALDSLEREVKVNLNRLSVSSPVIVKKTFGRKNIKDTLTDHAIVEKKFEKQIMKKGWYQLLSDIRMPLFMMMPLLMVGGLFYAMVVGKERGEFDFEMINGTKFLVIKELISSKGIDYNVENYLGKLIAEIRNDRWNEEGTQNVLFKHKLDNTNKFSRPKIILFYDITINPDFGKGSKTPSHIRIPLVKPEYEETVRRKLNSSEYNASLISKSSGASLGGISRIMDPLVTHNKIALPLISLLLFWFIRKKKKEFHLEQLEVEMREKQSLKDMMKQDVQRIIKYSGREASSKITNYVLDYQNNFLQGLENCFSSSLIDRKSDFEERIATMNMALSQIESQKKIEEQKFKLLSTNTQKLKKLTPQFRTLIKE